MIIIVLSLFFALLFRNLNLELFFINNLAIWATYNTVLFMDVKDFREFIAVPANKANLIDLFAVDIPAQAEW